ncbi:QacE family quaternary ammonium compound efflux SMR transporter [Leuconostoc mesenteroides]|uniref:DMT family transporter n=1 Tax=Leuconostoc mesenteroides TaxID=1245 RepID=UPI002953C530|nr:multidrug efflux SMR transporter [Leuconostoc mesenteroides]MDV7740390.1 QacE family quaternary ammonium compound efflux SMR transporter [Leuconostoc mesenteroides]
MTWFYLFCAGLFEVLWSSAMKLSAGFSHVGWTIATVFGMLFSFGLLSLSLKSLPLSIAYPIWTGIGAIGAILVGVVLFGDKIPLISWLFIFLLIVGIIGLKLTAGH